MAPFRSSGRRDRPGRTQIDHDVFEGLPIRQWKQIDAPVGPPPVIQPISGKNVPWPELPMPHDWQMLPEVSQQLLRAARAGRLYKPPTPQNDEEEKDAEEEADTTVKTTPKGFMARKWSQLPRHMEGTEREYLAKRRKGLSSAYVNGTAQQAQTHSVGTTRITKVQKTDADGNVVVYEVQALEGQPIEGEIIPEAALEAPPSIATVAPGTVVEGVGVANADGVVVAATDIIQPTPPRRKPPPPRKKKKGPGRGHKKVVLVTPGGDVTTTAGQTVTVDANGLALPTALAEDATPADGDTIMVDAVEGDETSDEDGDEGEEGDEEEEGSEEGELAPTLTPEGSLTPPQTLPPALTSAPASTSALPPNSIAEPQVLEASNGPVLPLVNPISPQPVPTAPVPMETSTSPLEVLSIETTKMEPSTLQASSGEALPVEDTLADAPIIEDPPAEGLPAEGLLTEALSANERHVADQPTEATSTGPTVMPPTSIEPVPIVPTPVDIQSLAPPSTELPSVAQQPVEPVPIEAASIEPVSDEPAPVEPPSDGLPLAEPASIEQPLVKPVDEHAQEPLDTSAEHKPLHERSSSPDEPLAIGTSHSRQGSLDQAAGSDPVPASGLSPLPDSKAGDQADLFGSLEKHLDHQETQKLDE